MVNFAKTSAVMATSLAVGAAMLAIASPGSAAQDEQQEQETIAGISTADLKKREIRTLRMWLEGRQPGAERQCVRLRFIRRSVNLGDDIMLYEMRGGTILVNRTSGQCNNLGGNGVINRSPDDNICEGQIFDVQDFQARIPLGSCSYGKFVEYEEIGKDSAD